jgi:hypothetical protein
MPKKKGIYANLPKLIYRDSIDKILFGYVMGFRNRNELQILEIKAACEQFLEDMEISECEYSLENAMQTFYRMHLTYSEFRKYNRDGAY